MTVEGDVAGPVGGHDYEVVLGARHPHQTGKRPAAQAVGQSESQNLRTTKVGVFHNRPLFKQLIQLYSLRNQTLNTLAPACNSVTLAL